MPLQSSGSISMTQINNEVASVNSQNLKTLSTNALAYNNGQGNGTTNAPYQMKEFLGYTHTQNMPTFPAYTGGVDGNRRFWPLDTSISYNSTNMTAYGYGDAFNDWEALSTGGIQVKIQDAVVSGTRFLFAYARFADQGITDNISDYGRTYNRNGTQANLGEANNGSFVAIGTVSVPSAVTNGLSYKLTTSSANQYNTGSGSSSGTSSGSYFVKNGNANWQNDTAYSTYGANTFVTANGTSTAGVTAYTSANSFNSGVANSTRTHQRMDKTLFEVTVRKSGYVDAVVMKFNIGTDTRARAYRPAGPLIP